MRRRWLRNDPEHLRAAGTQVTEAPDRTEELARVPVPKMVISGSPDATWGPSQLSDLAERLSAVLLPIPGGGRTARVLERPDGELRAVERAETGAALGAGRPRNRPSFRNRSPSSDTPNGGPAPGN